VLIVRSVFSKEVFSIPNMIPQRTTQRRRHSVASFGVGFTNTNKLVSTSTPLCTCNAELMKEELRQFRISSAEAVQNSWNEVETLQTTCAEYDQKIDDLTRQIQCKTTHLEDSLTCSNNLEEELDALTNNELSSTGEIVDSGSAHHSHTKDNIHNHDDHERQDQETLEDESKRLKQILVSRNLTVDNMEYVLAQNVKMMQNFQIKLQETEEKRS